MVTYTRASTESIDLQVGPALLETLREAVPPGGRVLSVYLGLGPGRAAGQAPLLAFREGVTALRAELPAGERERFERAAAQAERYLAQELPPGQPGVAVFASGHPDFFHAVPLPERPVDSVAWGERAELEPLQAVLDEFERVAVLLFDAERARLFTIHLGRIEEHAALVDEVPGKQATGDWFALAQTRYARHREDHLLRHARRAIRALTGLLRRHAFDRLLLAGPPEPLALLRQHLPRPLRARLAGELRLELFASDAEVLATALEAAEEVERQAEAELVRELLEAATSSYAAVGLDETLAALSEGRVHLLLVAEALERPGAECPGCWRLWAETESEACPACGTEVQALPALAERAVERALEQAARVELVRGPAAAMLLAHGGMGAWTRY
jgi:peptide subunit release factor 1 (eRF1)